MMEGIPLYFDYSQIPTFHPIHRREDGVLYPGNEAASLLIHISHVWEDILMLREMMVNSSNKTEERLLFKYVLVELHSILQPISRLQAIIMTAPERKPGVTAPYCSVSEEDRETAKRLFKDHNAAKNKVEALISDIRNKIGAHRELLVWERIIQLWDSLEPQHFQDLLTTIPPVFNFAKDLDLFTWTRTTDTEAIEIYVGGPWYPLDPESEGDST